MHKEKVKKMLQIITQWFQGGVKKNGSSIIKKKKKLEPILTD